MGNFPSTKHTASNSIINKWGVAICVDFRESALAWIFNVVLGAIFFRFVDCKSSWPNKRGRRHSSKGMVTMRFSTGAVSAAARGILTLVHLIYADYALSVRVQLLRQGQAEQSGNSWNKFHPSLYSIRRGQLAYVRQLG